MTRCRATVLLAAVLTLATGTAPSASAQRGAVEGVARVEGSGAPVQFALVRLVAADSGSRSSDGAPKGITNAAGRYRFDDVAPGRYRVQLLRIGFRPVLSDTVQVAGGESVQLELHVASQPVLLPPISVTADVCVTTKGLKDHPRLQTLWQQARDGASLRTEVMSSYKYQILLHEEGFELTADGRTPGASLDQTRVNDPRFAAANAARNRAYRLNEGYYGPNDGWYPPNELDVLHPDFLKGHCLYPTAEQSAGELGVRFRPLRVIRNRLDARGTIWLDSVTFLARRIELDYVDGKDSRGTVRIDFGDVAFAGGTLRMPVGGTYAMRPSRKNPDRRTEGTFAYTYSAFEEKPRH